MNHPNWKRVTVRQQFVWLASITLLATVPVSAKIDTFTINHDSGPCSNAYFGSGHFEWSHRSRVQIASGERITVTLYGHGADFAQDATGSNLHEWITGRGTTTDYPGAPIMFGGVVPKGYVNVAVSARPSDGLGNRTVYVKWLTGTERFNLKIVAADCTSLAHATYRTAIAPGSSGSTAIVQWEASSLPNVMPALGTPVMLTRSTWPQVFPTTAGGMTQVNSFFCSDLAKNVVTDVPVPRLTWGVSGTNIESANTQFDVQLIDMSTPDHPLLLDTLSLAQGFPAHTPLVQKDNYPGRPTSIRVIRDPRFQEGPSTKTIIGCYTEPGSTQLLDPRVLLIKVDSNNQIAEGDREYDNELLF